MRIDCVGCVATQGDGRGTDRLVKRKDNRLRDQGGGWLSLCEDLREQGYCKLIWEVYFELRKSGGFDRELFDVVSTFNSHHSPVLLQVLFERSSS